MDKDKMGILCVIIGVALGALGALVVADGMDTTKFLTIIFAFMIDDIDDLRLILIFMIFMMSSDWAWALVYVGLGACGVGVILSAVD